MRHNSVLLQEVLEHLALKPGAVVMDGTLGSGGHAEAMLMAIGPAGRLIGFDQDPEAIARAKEKLAETHLQHLPAEVSFGESHSTQVVGIAQRGQSMRTDPP